MTHEVTQVELARILPLTTRQLRNLEREGLPHRADGRRKLYPLPEAVDWYIRYRENLARAEFDNVDYERARARYETARARLAEIGVAREEGRLIPVEVVEEIYGDRLMDVLRTGILNLPGRWGAQLVGLDSPREAEAILKRIARELLQEFSGPAAAALEAEGDDTLPEDFPGRRALLEAGVATWAELLAIDDLEAIRGIGPATAKRIREAMERDVA